jgi:alpha-galactosidase
MPSLTDPAAAGPFTHVAEVPCDLDRTRVYESGWQSWSPSGCYPATATSPRPRRPQWQVSGHRPGKPAPPSGFQGEGLLAIVPDDGPVRVWHAPDPWREVASVRAQAVDGRLVVTADGAVVETSAANLAEGLARVADVLAAAGGVEAVQPLGPGWCSWYCYWGDVTEHDVVENLAAMDRLDLDIRVVQIDDGHQAGIGDWLDRSPRFGPLRDLAGRIADTGRRAGLWTAPFCVGASSDVAQRHPDWLVDGAVALEHQWDQQVRVLDVTHPDAAEHLGGVFRSLAEDGFDYHKVDFIYAGAMDGGRHADCSGLDAYTEGLRIIREALGPDATILGCGAPLLPSIGRVDAMRIGPDIDPRYEPADGDLSQPSQRSAAAAVRARGWTHGRLWVNDPDCLIVRPDVERRQDWATLLQQSGGLMVSSDALDALDEQGLAWTRQLLRPSTTEPGSTTC